MAVFKMTTVSVEGIGTYGRIVSPNGIEICKTVEREWNNNRQSNSCVPEGLYELLPVDSPKYGKCYCLVNADLGVTHKGPSQRTHILIHAANWPRQLQGCIAPVVEHGSTWGGNNSREALAVLEDSIALCLANGTTYLDVKRSHF